MLQTLNMGREGQKTGGKCQSLFLKNASKSIKYLSPIEPIKNILARPPPKKIRQLRIHENRNREKRGFPVWILLNWTAIIDCFHVMIIITPELLVGKILNYSL